MNVEAQTIGLLWQSSASKWYYFQHLKLSVILTSELIFDNRATWGSIQTEPPHDKTNKMTCTQRRLISAWAFAQSDQSLLSAWRKLGCLATHSAHSEDSDQTGPMSSLGARPFCWFCHEAVHVYQQTLSIWPMDGMKVWKISFVSTSGYARKFCLFWFNVTFNSFSVISQWCLAAAGNSMLAFIALPHWSIMPQISDMIPHPLPWHWVYQS